MYFVELLRCSGKHFELYIILYMLKKCDVFKQQTLIILTFFSIFKIHQMQFILHLFLILYRTQNFYHLVCLEKLKAEYYF